jgi:hypothetical protein
MSFASNPHAGCETVLTRQEDAVDQLVMCSGCHTATCFLCGDEVRFASLRLASVFLTDN